MQLYVRKEILRSCSHFDFMEMVWRCGSKYLSLLFVIVKTAHQAQVIPSRSLILSKVSNHLIVSKVAEIERCNVAAENLFLNCMILLTAVKTSLSFINLWLIFVRTECEMHNFQCAIISQNNVALNNHVCRCTSSVFPLHAIDDSSTATSSDVDHLLP